MSDISEWTASTGRKFRVPKHRKLTDDEIKAMVGNYGCRLGNISIPDCGCGCGMVACTECVFNNWGGRNDSITESEFMEFYNQEFKMSKKREIQYREIGRTATHVVVEITKQPFVRFDFSKEGNCFMHLVSTDYPQYLAAKDLFYVRGILTAQDAVPLCIPLDKFEIFAAEVAEYNRTEGGFKKVNWRAEKGGRYWFVYSDSSVGQSAEHGDTTDDLRYNAGNYYRDEATAKEAARSLKECFEQHHKKIGE